MREWIWGWVRGCLGVGVDVGVDCRLGGLRFGAVPKVSRATATSNSTKCPNRGKMPGVGAAEQTLISDLPPRPFLHLFLHPKYCLGRSYRPFPPIQYCNYSETPSSRRWGATRGSTGLLHSTQRTSVQSFMSFPWIWQPTARWRAVCTVLYSVHAGKYALTNLVLYHSNYGNATRSMIRVRSAHPPYSVSHLRRKNRTVHRSLSTTP